VRRDTLIQLFALSVMTLCLIASIFLSTRVSASAGRNRLVYADTAEAGDPPEVAAGIAMGAFRGIFVNFLWIRANNLKEAGKYYEAIDLAKTITRLQPRSPKVWSFHAWNLAYNISVATQTPQERWKWVDSGIRLLRDQGIPANNSDLVLHKELAWIYLHKVEGYMDDAHQYYKRAHALEWGLLMGKPPQMPLGLHTREAASKLYIDEWLLPLTNAASSLDELYQARPENRELVERIKSEAGLELNMDFLEYLDRITNAIRAAGIINHAPDLNSDPLARIIADPKFKDAGTDVKRYVRRKLLTETYHMELERMIRYTQDFGPLDWRHPAAHALYWARRGVEEAERRVTVENRSDFDFVNTDRLVVQSVQSLFRTGLLFTDTANPDFYVALVNPDFLDTYEEYREEATKRGGVFESARRTRTEYREGLENFYRDAIRYLYRRGDRERAEKYYQKLRTADWLNDNSPDKKFKLSLPLEEFVVREITDDDRITSPQVATQEIQGALESAYIEGLLGGNTPIFVANFTYARKFHAEYQQSQSFRTWVAGEQGRLGFPPFMVFASDFLSRIIIAANVPQGPTIYQRAPEALRARTYVLLEFNGLRGAIDKAAEQGSPAFDVWFPPPPGVEEARAELLAEADRIKRGNMNQTAPK